jgi:polysaccharide deacetylase family protein (PEP-CTERM system associated)
LNVATVIDRNPVRNSDARVGHFFTVDVEEYFQVSALEPFVERIDWDSYESRVTWPMQQLLRLLARKQARGTFFVLGWVAERMPELVHAIVAGGHELASHGWDHKRITELTPDEFRKSVRRSKQLLEDISGEEVIGFRAPSFSIVPGREWAFDVLVEEGYRYDSSVFPIRRPGYGYPGAPTDFHWIGRPSGRLGEFPPTTLRRAGMNIPAGGGGYFRLLPYALTKAAFADCAAAASPGVFYIHPWELDPGQPRFQVPLTTRIRHYGRLHATLPRLERLLGDFEFPRTMADVFRELEQRAESAK